MKAKLKIDVESIKKSAIEHGEKVALGVMALVFLGFVYYAIKRDTLDESKQPEKLQAVANNVRTRVSSSKWDAKREGLKIIDYEKRTKRDAVDAGKFAVTNPLNHPLIEEKIKRDDPKLFNVEEARVAAGMGPFALNGDGALAAAPVVGPPKPAGPAGPLPVPGAKRGLGGWGNIRPGGGINKPAGPAPGVATQSGHGYKPTPTAKLQPQAWAVITALVPIDKQRKEYARVFERAMGEDLARDTPHYATYLINRTEIQDADPNKTDWKPVEDPTIYEAKWENTVAEIIAPDRVDPVLTAPLGPLVGTAWGESVAHPKIPPASAQTSQLPDPAALPPNQNEDKEKEAAKPPAEDGLGGLAGRRNKVVPAPLVPLIVPQVAAGPPPISYRLLRIFDYSVQPNKRYRYRVKLALENPNWKVADRNLKNPGAPLPKERATEDWIETDVVTIPNGHGVLAGGLAAGIKPKHTADLPRAKVLLNAIDKDKGVEATVVKEFERGAVANVKEKEVKARDPRTDQTIELKDVDFTTNAVVLDIFGGRSLSTKKRDTPLVSPIEVLLLDASGHLTVRSELDDHAMFEQRKPPAEAESRAADKSPLIPPPEKKKNTRRPG